MVRMLPRARGWAEKYHRKSVEEVGPLAAACTNPRCVAAFEAAVAALAARLAAVAEEGGTR
jgi:hypothetical protein